MVHKRLYKRSDLKHYAVRYTPKFQKSLDLEYYCCEGGLEQVYNKYDSLKYFENYFFRSYPV